MGNDDDDDVDDTRVLLKGDQAAKRAGDNLVALHGSNSIHPKAL